jgi:hypothetical protein
MIRFGLGPGARDATSRGTGRHPAFGRQHEDGPNKKPVAFQHFDRQQGGPP